MKLKNQIINDLGMVILLLISFPFSQTALAERYHSYPEIQEQLLLWDDEFGDSVNPNYPEGGIIYKLIEIGYSQEDNLPFWAVKLTYNSDLDGDKPKILILGQCHAEEILGVEISMALIDILLHPVPQPGTYNMPYPNGYRPSFGDLSASSITSILEFAEVWVVPTHNPEGLSVVHGWEENSEWFQDVTYRKNKHDLDGNNIFNFIVGQGNDSDGVDLNRNYDFNWAFGDPIYEPDNGGCNGSYYTDFDYYRGGAPFSESEVRAISDLALENNFLVSIAYHSSRSGCLSEKVKYSWEWEGEKFTPDHSVISKLGEDIAGFIETVSGSGNGYYEPSPSGSFKGVAHNWFYSKTGCFQYLIEVAEGDEGMQPDEDYLINSILQNNLKGAFYAINRTAGLNLGTLGAEKYMITGVVSDLNTGEIIEGASVKILEMDGGILSPRLSDSFGRYRRLLIDESYTLEVSSLGYNTQVFQFSPSANEITAKDFLLEPIVEAELLINVEGQGDNFNNIYFTINHNNGLVDEMELIPGIQNFQYPIGNYFGVVNCTGRAPFSINFEIYPEIENNIDILLHEGNIVLSESVDLLENWNIISGNWNISEGKLLSQSEPIYAENEESVIDYIINLSLEIDTKYSLSMDLAYELEWDKDSLIFELYDEGSLLQTKILLDQNWEFHNEIIFIPTGTNYLSHLKIKLITDSSVNYRGIQIDAIELISTDSSDLNGDINFDGIVDILDVVSIVNFIMGTLEPTEAQSIAADYNFDGTIDILDVVQIVNIILE
jgi:hypothetical protein